MSYRENFDAHKNAEAVEEQVAIEEAVAQQEAEKQMGPIMSNSIEAQMEPSYSNNSPSEGFSNMSLTFNTDLVLKALFWGCFFYLLSLPEVYKYTAKLFGKKVDKLLLHAVVYAVLYFFINQLIN